MRVFVLAASASWMAVLWSGPMGCSAPTRAKPAVPDAGGEIPTLEWKIVEPASPSVPTLTAVWAHGDDVYASSAAANWPATVVSSHDGGRSWTTVAIGQADTVLRGVAADQSNRVFAAGFQLGEGFVPFIASSGDGGKTFVPLSPGFSGHPHGVAVDPTLGILIVGADTGGGFFARSTDGGATWVEAPVPGAADLNALWVSAEGEIYAAGAQPLPSDGGAGAVGPSDSGAAAEDLRGLQGLVVRSDDGGATWAAVLSGTPPLGPDWAPSGPGTTPAALFAISGTADGARIVATGDLLTIVESTDHGATWLVDGGGPPSLTTPAHFVGDEITGVWVPDATSSPYMAAGLCLGLYGGLLRGIGYPLGLVDGAVPGLSLALQSIDGNPTIYAVTGGGAGDGWAVGVNGVIVHGVPQ